MIIYFFHITWYVSFFKNVLIRKIVNQKNKIGYRYFYMNFFFSVLSYESYLSSEKISTPTIFMNFKNVIDF